MSHDAAFADAYREHYWAISRFVARRLTAESCEVEEVVADVFAVAWRRRAELPECPLPWLYGVARLCVANTVRGRGRYRRLLLKLGGHETTRGPRVAESPDAEPAGAWVREAMARLSDADQEVLRLSAWEELTVDELGEVLGCSRTAAGMRLHRARQRLRAQIERRCPTAEDSTPARRTTQTDGD